MSQTNGQNLSIHLDLVAVEGRAPINVLCPQHNWLLIRAMFQNGHMHRLVELEEHCWVEFDLFVVSDKLKHERFIEDGVAGCRHDLGAEPTLEEADGDGNLFVGPHIYKVDEGMPTQQSATHVPLVGVKVLLCEHPPLTGCHIRQTSLLLTVALREGVRDVGCAAHASRHGLALGRDLLEDFV